MIKRRQIMVLAGIILALVAGVGVLAVVASQRTPAEAPIAQAEGFPILRGTNLLLQEVNLPEEIEGEAKLLVVAYDTDQQATVDKWLVPLEALNSRYPACGATTCPSCPRIPSTPLCPSWGG
ncbi:MAG: hypothetical protein HC915_11335 [Anaerolineae bacterium]|nr:hypothetical protein [Anaerolineae bacterium]